MDESSELNPHQSALQRLRTLPPFVNRTQQLTWLELCLREAQRGQPHVVLLEGEAGMGKTRLVKEFRSIALARQVQVFYGRCYEDLALPYLPFIEALLPRLEHDAGGTERSRANAQMIGRLFHRYAASVDQFLAAETDQDRMRLFLAVSQATIKLGQEAPALLVIEDLHWADRASLDLLSHIVFAVSDTAVREPVPLMVIATCRPVEAETHAARVLARIQREDPCQTMELPGFGEPEVDELLRGLELAHPSHQLVATVTEATRGNPLFVEEVVTHLAKRGALREQGGYVVTTASPADLHFPDQITGAISARTQGLSENCRRTLVAAAILGDSFSLATLSEVSAVGEEELLDLLEEAIRQRLLVSEGQTFQFAHPLVRHVFYNEPSAARRQRIHQRVAETLERLYADSIDQHLLEIAHHLAAAGPVADGHRVVSYARRAGDRALSMFAWGEAARYYEAAVAAAASTPDFDVQATAALHYYAGLAHYRDMDVGPCLDHFEKAIAAYRLSNDISGSAQALVDKARAHLTLAAIPYGTLLDVQPLMEALTALGDREPGLQGRIWAILAQVYWTARQPEKMEQAAGRALEIAERLDDDRLRVEAIGSQGLAQTQRLHVREGLASWERSLACARRADDPWLQGWLLQRIPLALSGLGRLDEAQGVALEAGALTRKTLDWAEHSLALTSLTFLAVAKGDFDLAETHAREAMAMVQRSGYPWGGPLFLPALACARALRGEWADAHDALDTLVQPRRVFTDPGPAIQFIAWVYQQLIRVYARTIVDAEAREFGATLLKTLKGNDVDINTLMAFCALVEIGDGIGAAELIAEAYPILQAAAERGIVFCNGWVFLLPRLLGVAAALERRWDQAEGYFNAAIATATQVGARPDLGRSYLDYARMLTTRDATNDQSHAAELLQRAVPLLSELHMCALLERATHLAEALHVALPPSLHRADASGHDLTVQELKVLRSIARARTTQQIGNELMLSPQTVASYARTIFEKIGVDGTAAATAYAEQRGLVSEPARWTHRNVGAIPNSPVSGVGATPGPGSLPSVQPLVILFTDMEGSTALIQRLGDARAQHVVRRHNTIIRDCLRQHGGSEINQTGDGVMASFPSVSDAIACSVAIQQTLAQHTREYPDTPIRVRIGLNAGEPRSEDGQLFGSAVNAAARICARARPGQILVSEVVRQLAAGKDITFVDRGRVSLKGFTERFHLYGVQWEGEVSTVALSKR